MSQENRELLQMKDIRKQFPGVLVLNDVDFSVGYGEVHALMGENGAGKSTLIKILTGIYAADGGEIWMDGKKVDIRSKHDAAANGISVIYQELSLIPTLSVIQNMFLGQELAKGKFLLSKKAMYRRARELMEKCNFTLDLDAPVESLSVAKQQMVEILKSLLYDAKLIIMDEPTASLNMQESESLFRIISHLKKNGTSIIYISHRLEEVWQLADRLTVLRDGCVCGVLNREEIDPVKVVHMMLGKDLKGETRELHAAKPDASVLKVDGLSIPGCLENVSFEARGGQILGIGGLVGAGRTEILESIYGLRKYAAGSITLDGKPVAHSAGKAVRQGVGLVPEDRRREGLVQSLSVADNIALSNYDVLFPGVTVHPSKIMAQAKESIELLRIKAPSGSTRCMNLSGGNQQKVVLAKWLMRDLKVLLVDEPTVGIDIGSKTEIYEILRSIADKGSIVVVVSSDTEELLKISDRILIMVGGKVFADMPNQRLTADDLLLEASGIHSKKEEA